MSEVLPERMHGLVLCAGLGTRLRPLTHILPKPAVPVGALPAALRNIEQLLNAGFEVVHCNTHYLAEELKEQLLAAALSRGWPTTRMRFWHEPDLLETGGGIARIVHSTTAEMGHNDVWDTLVVSGDIVADIPLKAMLERWSRRSGQDTALMATLPLNAPRKDVTWIDGTARFVCGFGADASPESAQAQGWIPRIFSNHQIVSGEMIKDAPVEKRSSIDLFYRAALRTGRKIIHVPLPENALWFDIGTPESYFECLSKLPSHDDHPYDWSRSTIHVVMRKSMLTTWSEESGLNSLDHDEAAEQTTTLDQSCISKLAQRSWQRLGCLHTFPASFISGLERLIADLDGVGGSQRSPQDSVTSLAAPGAFLRSSSSALTLSESHTLPRQGYIESPLPAHLRAHPRLTEPLLVSLSSLVPDQFNPVTQEPGPFWILFTPPQLSEPQKA